ncbi:MAG: catalase family peroxidase [Chromatiales bacterium]
MHMFQRIGLICVVSRALFGAPAAAEVTGKDLVDALNGIFGQHAGKRASHAKGVCAAGTFQATSDAAQLSKAPHFAGESVPAVIRFSMGGGNPAISDKTNTARGMAIRFALPDDEITDLVMISAPMFFARTPEDALQFLRVRKADPATGEPDPVKVEEFSKAHPETTLQGAWLKAHPLPNSYLTTPHFGVNAFKFTNDAGQSVFGRWQFEPVGGVVGLSEEEAKTVSDDFLTEDLRKRLAAGPSDFDVHVQLAEEGDPINDPTAVWPDTRERVHVGKLSVTKAAGQECDGIMFNPIALPAGIEPSDDPILRIRAAAYAESFVRRQQN